jgi:hypothetical protein
MCNGVPDGHSAFDADAGGAAAAGVGEDAADAGVSAGGAAALEACGTVSPKLLAGAAAPGVVDGPDWAITGGGA